VDSRGFEDFLILRAKRDPHLTYPVAPLPGLPVDPLKVLSSRRITTGAFV
jgi:hypothetical protein